MNKIEERDSPALVSVIIPVYNGEKYLEEAIQSVLNQSYHPLDFILVDDGSEDGSARIAKKHVLPLRYAYQEHKGKIVYNFAAQKINVTQSPIKIV